MRVLVVTDQWFPDRVSGASRVATATARILAARGHEVTVLAPRVAGLPDEATEERLRLLRRLPRSFVPQTLTDVTATRRIAGKLGPFDVVLAHEPTVAAGVATSGLSAPLVIVYHASPALEARYLASRRPFSRRGLAARSLVPALFALERIALAKAARVLVLSDFSRSLVTGARPSVASKVRLVGGGVDAAYFSPGDAATARRRVGMPVDEPLLFSARRLEPRMGLDALLDAVRDLPGARLGLAGSGSLEAALQRRADLLGITERVLFLGRISEEELRNWYRAADVVVMPTDAYEGFGLATVEALACGTPVVGTPVGATPELLLPLDRALIAMSVDAAALAAALSATLARVGPDLRRRCREYAFARFAWENVAEAWEKELLRVVGERAPAQIDLFGLRLDALSVPEVVARVESGLADGRPVTHASVNAAKAVRVQKDPDLRAALRDSDLVTADGQPVVWAARLAGRRLPERVAGIDLMEGVLGIANRRGYRVYLLGAQPEVVAAAAAEVRRRFPGATVVGTQDGYFSPDDEAAVVERITAAKPDILFIALGTPEKELFQLRHRNALGAGFVMGVGGAFDVLAGRLRRAPRWAQRLGLEWLFRLAQEPKRLGRRYLTTNARFVRLVISERAHRRRRDG